MKKSFPIRLLLALFMLCIGASTWAAKGDVTTNADIDFSNAVTGSYAINGTVGSMQWTSQWTQAPYVEDGMLKFGNFSGGVVAFQNGPVGSKDKVTISFELAFGKLSGKYIGFSFRDASDNELLTQKFRAYNGDFDGANPLNLNWDDMYHGSNTPIWDRRVNFTIEIDYATKKITTTTSCYMEGPAKPEKLKEASVVVDLPSTTPIAKFVLLGNTNNSGRVSWLDNLLITTTEGDYSGATAAYTVKFKCGNNDVKLASSREGDVGEAITLTTSDKANFYQDNKKYIYESDDAEGKTVAGNGSTVVTINFREAKEYSYTVNGVDGSNNILAQIATGTTFEGDAVTVPYQQYILSGTTLYGAVTGTSDWYRTTFTPTSDNFVQNVAYTNGTVQNVVFYTEAENIEGASVGTNTARASNGQMGYTANSTTYVNAATLNPGVYKIYARGVNGNSAARTNNFKLGDKVVFTWSIPNGTNNLGNSDEIVVSSEGQQLMFASDGSSASGCDWFYIQKTADYVATDELLINLNEITIGENTKMTATLLPANASNKTLTWTIKESNSIDKGEAEIDAATGEITPKKAGLIAVEVTNGEKTDTKEFTIAAAQFDVTITDAPQEAQVFVGDDASVENKLYVSTKAGYDDMQNTSLLQPVGSVTATKIPTYIYTITVDKKNKTVDVVYEEDIEVTAMNFAQPTQRIANGNSRTMQVVYSPADASFKTAKFTSSNPEVATVDENTGLVTAISEGETTITAEWSENESHGTNISTQMTLTVDKGLVLDRIVYDEMEDATAEVMGYYHPMDGDTLFLPAYIESNGREIPVSFIKQEAFIGSNLKSIVIPGTVKTIDHRALMYSNTHNAYNEMPEEGLESAFLLEGVEVMRDRIFHGNKYMKKVFLPSTLTDIGYYSFFDTAIEDVYFGGTAEQWNALKNLENAKLPESIKIHFNSDFTTAFINSIEVEEDYAEIAVGEEYEVKVSIIPEEIAPVVALTYTSSNEEVATVDEEGVVTGIADGYVTITVSAGEGLEAKVRVKVGDAARDYTTPLLTTWSVQGGANPEGIFVDEEEHYYNNWGAGTSWFAQAYAQFDLSNLQPTDDFKATFTVWVNCARGTRNFDICGLSANATVADCQELTAKKGVELASYSDITTEYTAKEVDVTEYLKTILSEGATTAIFIMSNGAAGGKIYGKGSAEFAPTLNIYPANGSEGGNQATGINEAKAEKSVKNGKYVENGQIVIYIDGKKFNAAGQELK
jgi:uncharacterized protein YjdB